MGWLEFTVVIVCCLVGFVIVSAVIDYRRSGPKGQQGYDGASSEQSSTNTPTDQPSWWEVLRVDRSASPDQIKSAFRKEIAKYHPDRVEGLGIELRELAEEKAKEVNLAYAAAKKERRFS